MTQTVNQNPSLGLMYKQGATGESGSGYGKRIWRLKPTTATELRAVAMGTVIGKESRQKGASFLSPNFCLSISLECPLVAESARKPPGKGDI